MNRRQSDPAGNTRKKGPSYFTFSPGDQAVGHSGFDKLLKWAEIDFPANPVYAEAQYLPQLKLPETVTETKLVESFSRSRISGSTGFEEPMTAPVRPSKHNHHHVTFAVPASQPEDFGTSPPSSQSRSRNIRPARKSLERQWIALAHQHFRSAASSSSASSSSAQPPTTVSSAPAASHAHNAHAHASVAQAHAHPHAHAQSHVTAPRGQAAPAPAAANAQVQIAASGSDTSSTAAASTAQPSANTTVSKS